MEYRKPFLSVCLTAWLAMWSFSASAAGDLGPEVAAKCPAFAAWMQAHPNPNRVHGSASHATPEDPALRKQLLAMLERDQKARQAMDGAKIGGADDPRVRHMLAVDADNLNTIRAIIDAHGFPTPALVGRDGVDAAFILVQHADRDPAFQVSVLPQLAKLRAQGEVSNQQFALLTDRVLRAQGKPQRYGTQFGSDKGGDGVIVPEALEDPAHVDARRAAIGLPPLSMYACLLSATYGQPVSTGSTGSTAEEP